MVNTDRTTLAAIPGWTDEENREHYAHVESLPEIRIDGYQGVMIRETCGLTYVTFLVFGGPGGITERLTIRLEDLRRLAAGVNDFLADWKPHAEEDR